MFRHILKLQYMTMCRSFHSNNNTILICMFHNILYMHNYILLYLCVFLFYNFENKFYLTHKHQYMSMCVYYYLRFLYQYLFQLLFVHHNKLLLMLNHLMRMILLAVLILQLLSSYIFPHFLQPLLHVHTMLHHLVHFLVNQMYCY